MRDTTPPKPPKVITGFEDLKQASKSPDGVISMSFPKRSSKAHSLSFSPS